MFPSTVKYSDPSMMADIEAELSEARSSAASGTSNAVDPLRKSIICALSPDALISRDGFSDLKAMAALQNIEAQWWLSACYLERGDFWHCRQGLEALVLREPEWERGACLLEVYKTRVLKKAGDALKILGRIFVCLAFGAIGLHAFSRTPLPSSPASALKDGLSKVSRKISDLGGSPSALAASGRIYSGVDSLKRFFGSALGKARLLTGS